MLAALALLAQSGTIAIAGGLTPSAVTISLPAARPGMTRVHLSIAHQFAFTHGWETDGAGTFATWAHFRGWWWLSAGGVPVGGGRVSAQSSAFGDLVPFDGVWDWAGTSGDANVYGCDTVLGIDVAAGVPLVLSGRAVAPHGIALSILGYGACTSLVRSEWSAVVAYTFLR